MKSSYFYEDLKNVFFSGVSFKYDGEYVLESKYGKINFSFIEDFDKISFFLKRISGNGKILINNVPYIVSSKSSEEQIVSIQEKNITISRASDSLGEISIIGIVLHLKEEDEISMNWKSLVKKLSNYKGLSLVNNELLAKESAYIEPADKVNEIVTLPNDATYLKDNKIIFKYSCKILKLSLSDSSEIRSNIDVYAARSAPNPVLLEESLVSNNLRNLPSAIQPYTSSKSNMLHSSIKVVYDSDTNNGLHQNNYKNYNNLLKFINSNNKNYIFIKPGGNINISLSGVEPNKKYIAIINGKKISGSGKANIEASLNQKNSFIFNNSFQDKTFNFNSYSHNDSFDSFKLNINIDEMGIGEIVISRVLIIEDLSDESLNDNVKSFSSHNANFINNQINKSNYYSSNYRNFVIVIPSYKNQEWAEKNILSALNQNYKNFRVLFTDDCSPDNTFNVVSKVVENHPNKNKATIVRNEIRKGALENLYNMIHSCDDDEIILTLDGDDWLAGPEVLNTLNVHYSGDVWMTYGQYQNYPDGGRGVAQQIPDHVIKTKNYRQHTWCSSHLRTFYAWLFKQIKKEDFYYEGNFMAMTWDMAMMFPMLEMSGHRSKFISEYLYIYNLVNPINDHKVNQKLQQKLDRLVRGMPKYPVLAKEPNHVLENRAKNIKNKIGLLIIATGKYDQFIPQLIESADKFYFKDNKFEVTYFIFTDKEITLNTSRNYKIINIEHRGFPYASMDRFKHFTNNSEELSKMDYLYYVDVDCKFVDHVSVETLGELVGVRHCGYFNGGGTFEENKNSVFYIDPKKYKYYFGGGFSGGSAKSYLELSRWCYEMIERDLQNNVMPTWHDETAINRYFLEHEPEIVLTPSYHYPENYSSYIAKWRPHKFSPKIMLLEKNHKAVR